MANQKILSIIILSFVASLLLSQDHALPHHSTRQLAGYTAKMLPQGKGQIFTSDLIVHTVEIGATDFYTIGGGGTYFPRWDTQLIIFKHKIGGQLTDKLSLALANYWIITQPILDDIEFAAPTTLVFTYEFDRVTATAAAGVIFSDDELNLTANIGLAIDLGSNFSLITENWWGYNPIDNTYNESIFVMGIAGRYVYKKFLFELGSVGGMVVGDDGNGGTAVPHLTIGFHF